MARRQTEEEKVKFEIPTSQAKRIREKEAREPAEVAKDHLMGLYDDKRRTTIKLKIISIGWLPEVYQAIVKHVGRGGVSNYIREAFYLAMIGDGHDIVAPPILKEGHIKTSGSRKKSGLPSVQPGRQSAVVPLVIPEQWYEVGNEVLPNKLGTYIKAVTQIKLQKAIKKQLPIQRGLGEWLNQ